MRWIGLRTLVLRECAVIVRFWRATLAPPVIATVLYFAVFGHVIGSRIGPLLGTDYAQFVMPGLVLLSVVPNSFGHTAGGILGAREFRYIEEMLVSPMADWMIVCGYVIGGMLRGLMTGLAVILAAFFFARPAVHSIATSLSALMLAAATASLLGFITGALARKFDQVTAIQTLVVVPLTFVSGVFAPLDMLPEWARPVLLGNPMFHLTNAMRFGVLRVAEVPVGVSMLFASSFAIVLMLMSIWLVARSPRFRLE